MSRKYTIGQRLSFDNALCTVRYVGPVQGTEGEWLGVEWDDPVRGKHSGEHKGKRYFTCISKQQTAASFVRPTRRVDQPQGFLEALRQKYASEFEEELAKRKAAGHDDVQMNELIRFNGKVVEEVGFEKIRKQLAELQDLKIVVLDNQRISGVFGQDDADVNTRLYREELNKIEQTCPKIAELDLSRNLLCRWRDMRDICEQLKRLKSLKLNGNRFEKVQPGLVFERISELHLDQTFMSLEEISSLTMQFPSLTSLTISTNHISNISSPLPATLRSITLESNDIMTLSSLKLLAQLPNLERLSVRGNDISTTVATQSNSSEKAGLFEFSKTLKSLDISRNRIDSWLFINDLPRIFPGLETLRISGNPLYDRAVAPTNITGLPEKPMTVDEAFMLTLARLENLTSLNYSKITQNDRTNGELYYLSLIGKELSAFPASNEERILATHPRYSSLCEIYGEPAVKRRSDTFLGKNMKPGSVAARLVNFKFYQAGSPGSSPDTSGIRPDDEKREREYQIPRTFDVYRVKSIVSRLFRLAPLRFRLIWEMEEWDPVEEFNLGGEEWDSEDEEEEEEENKSKNAADQSDTGKEAITPMVTKADGSKFVRREVELIDSTRHVGFWFDDSTREPKYWCKQCQIYIRDTAFEKTQHEATGKHQGNLKRFLRDIHRNKEREQRDAARTQNEVERLRNLVSGKPAARTDATQTYRPSASSNIPRQATAEDRKKQVAQLVEMGVAVPEEYRRDMAIAGDWQTVSVTRIEKDEEKDAGGPRLNTGVRKRKHEENEDEEYEVQAAAENNVRHQGWGVATRSYPGAIDDTDDLDALLSSKKTVKRDEDVDTKPEPDAEDVVKESPVGGTGLTKADPDSAGPVKEEPGSLESSGDPLQKSEAQEAAPAIVFKKRKNKATKK
ncbi:Tubulin-specific chaperone E [Talaromyces islandicus]|uniref:Tubulin-specific chaperone E n=1 Tax=Talaromyces islandicus TaxID=28573 RepID=A0A0U1LQG1_TALIS|nr:Tubulin-specific chaperone E [Talaromyces islandicus]